MERFDDSLVCDGGYPADYDSSWVNDGKITKKQDSEFMEYEPEEPEPISIKMAVLEHELDRIIYGAE